MKTYGELFAGIGGASTGLKLAGYQPAYAIEWNLGAIDILAANHDIPQIIHNDVRNVYFSHLPEVDLLWASPVCCNFSRANPNAVESNDDLTTAEAVARAAHYTQSVIIENVPAYYNSEAFKYLKEKLEYIGFVHHNIYRLNAARFGNPASRDRSYAIFSREFFKLELPPESRTNWADELIKYREHWVESKLTDAQLRAVDRFYTADLDISSDTIAIERCGYYGDTPKYHIAIGGYPCIKSHAHHDGKNPKPGRGKIGSYRSYMDFVHEGKSYSITPQLLGVLNGFPIDYAWGDNRAQAAAGIGNAVVPRLAQILASCLF